jgi:hypothetical protein
MSMLRLAAHIHTEWSDDAHDSIAHLTRLLRRAGYDGALLCDHDRTMTEERWQQVVRECERGSRDGFVLVPGIEYQDRDHVVHLPVYGNVPFMGGSPDIGNTIRAAHAAGGAAVFAHPARRDAHERFDGGWSRFLSGIEVWNRKYDGIRPNGWALDTAAQHGLPAFVSLDYHGPRQLYPLAMRVDVPRGSTSSDVIAAIREKRIRATAFGAAPARFDHGLIGDVARGLENIRRRAAPQLRAFERKIRRAQ